MDKRAEIISMVERRRHWPAGGKLRIMEAALAPGTVIATVADRNGVCRSLLYTWLRQARSSQLTDIFPHRAARFSLLPSCLYGSKSPRVQNRSYHRPCLRCRPRAAAERASSRLRLAMAVS
jgi:transposase-like protein